MSLCRHGRCRESSSGRRKQGRWSVRPPRPPARHQGEAMHTEEAIRERKVYPAGNEWVVHVPNGRGEELRLHLASHGITAKVSEAAQTPFERVEVEGDTDAQT